MSVSVRNKINAEPHKLIAEYDSEKKSAIITEISVTARIDYILRYSKQAVLVIAEQTAQYTTLARQYLVTLSDVNSHDLLNQEHQNNHQCNVAFVSASIKLNDIQIRCRLVEQLFGNTLFDPEQSLTVSVLRLAKQQQEAVTIVIEHAQALSLQVKYELSQLVAIAKKNNQLINVVFFAQKSAAEEVSNNKSIFKNKLTIIDAVTGQLCNIESGKFSKKDNDKWLSSWQKFSLVIACSLMLLITVALFNYLQTDSGNEYLQKPVFVEPMAETIVDSAQILNIAKQEDPVSTSVEPFASLTVEKSRLTSNDTANGKEYEAASSQDVNEALLNPVYTEVVERLSAKTNDVLGAILSSETITLSNVSKPQSVIQPSVIGINALNIDYYTSQFKEFSQSKTYNESDIVVVQIAGFSDSKHWQDFLQQYPNETFYSYQRILSGTVFTVVTSAVFSDRLAAKKAMQSLPSALIEREIWLKPISTVIAEINTLNE